MTAYYCGAASYVLKSLDGWNVCMDQVLFDGTDLGDRTESYLLEDIRHIEGRLEPTSFAYLRDNTNIYVEKDSAWPGAVYHPSSVWLTNNGYPAYWEKSVMLTAEEYLDWTSCQPAILLSGLAHSWHDQYLGNDYQPIKDAYQNAVNQGTYESVEKCDGSYGNRAWALRSEGSYFAEITEAFFWENDYFPFDRDDLYAHDPVGAQMLEVAWQQSTPRPFLFSLLDDMSDWHVSDSSAIELDVSMDGRGKEIQFSNYWDTVYAQTYLADHENANVDWEALTQLNFDVHVRGGAPSYWDEWYVIVQAFDASDLELWLDFRHGWATEAGEDIHMQWDTREACSNWDNVDQIKVTFWGIDAEQWQGNYGVVFRGMDLYLSGPGA